MTDRSEEEENFIKHMLENSKLLEPEFAKVLNDNFWDLLMDDDKTIARKKEIATLLERLRVAWERRPEMSFDELVSRASRSKKNYSLIESSEGDRLITAIEKLCEVRHEQV